MLRCIVDKHGNCRVNDSDSLLYGAQDGFGSNPGDARNDYMGNLERFATSVIKLVATIRIEDSNNLKVIPYQVDSFGSKE